MITEHTFVFNGDGNINLQFQPPFVNSSYVIKFLIVVSANAGAFLLRKGAGVGSIVYQGALIPNTPNYVFTPEHPFILTNEFGLSFESSINAVKIIVTLYGFPDTNSLSSQFILKNGIFGPNPFTLLTGVNSQVYEIQSLFIINPDTITHDVSIFLNDGANSYPIYENPSLVSGATGVAIDLTQPIMLTSSTQTITVSSTPPTGTDDVTYALSYIHDPLNT